MLWFSSPCTLWIQSPHLPAGCERLEIQYSGEKRRAKVFMIQLVKMSRSPGLVPNATRPLVFLESYMEVSRPRRKLSPELGRDKQVRRKFISWSSGVANVKTFVRSNQGGVCGEMSDVDSVIAIQEVVLYSWNFLRSLRHFFHYNESLLCAWASLHHSRENLWFS